MLHISQAVIPSPGDLSEPILPRDWELVTQEPAGFQAEAHRLTLGIGLAQEITCNHADEMEAAEKEEQQVSHVICVKLRRKSRSRKIGVKK